MQVHWCGKTGTVPSPIPLSSCCWHSKQMKLELMLAMLITQLHLSVHMCVHACMCVSMCISSADPHWNAAYLTSWLLPQDCLHLLPEILELSKATDFAFGIGELEWPLTANSQHIAKKIIQPAGKERWHLKTQSIRSNMLKQKVYRSIVPSTQVQNRLGPQLHENLWKYLCFKPLGKHPLQCRWGKSNKKCYVSVHSSRDLERKWEKDTATVSSSIRWICSATTEHLFCTQTGLWRPLRAMHGLCCSNEQ